MSASQPLLQNLSPLPGGQRRNCPRCGQREVVTFAHLLNTVLVSGLWKLHEKGGGPIKIGDIGLLPGSEFNNFQKLRYFSLVAPLGRGEWVITAEGERFLFDGISMPAKVWTRKIDGKVQVVDREGSITLKEVSNEIWERADYAISARAAA